MLKIRLRKNITSMYKKYDLILTKNLKRQNYGTAKILGFYIPYTNTLSIKKFQLLNALNIGAQPTNSVRHLIKNFIFN